MIALTLFINHGTMYVNFKFIIFLERKYCTAGMGNLFKIMGCMNFGKLLASHKN